MTLVILVAMPKKYHPCIAQMIADDGLYKDLIYKVRSINLFFSQILALLKLE